MEEIIQSSELNIRKNKIQELKSSGIIPYVDKFERTHTILQAREVIGKKVKIAGRMIFKRVMGKFGFCQIRDIEAKIQVSVGRNEFDEESYNFYKKMIDIGDFIGVDGEVYLTQTGEVTVRAEKITLLSKTLRPLPEKFHGLTDTELKYRQRYLDLISNEDSRIALLGRSKGTSVLRRFLEDNGFIEIETPILQTNVSGASAKPFFTHHNDFDMDCNLRIAPETWLKQAIAGGFDRVFEVSKCFRNEGSDTQHIQEFTQVEWYASYWDFEDNIKFFQNLIKEILMKTTGKLTVEYLGKTLNFDGNWPRIDYAKAMEEILGFDYLNETDLNRFKQNVVNQGLFTLKDLEECKCIRTLIDFIFKRKIRANIEQPTILYNYPAVLKPLARRNDLDNRLVDVFQVVVMGFEICNAYSELVDPEVQRETFNDQLKEKELGDDETMDLDETFLLAMEHGMPPMSGLGVGLDRLFALIYNCDNIRDVVLFPLMKPINN